MFFQQGAQVQRVGQGESIVFWMCYLHIKFDVSCVIYLTHTYVDKCSLLDHIIKDKIGYPYYVLHRRVYF